MSRELSDTEELCRAIQSGSVDALVVGETDSRKRVLLMSDAYDRYRQIVEDMAQGAVTVSASGEILFANHAFAELLGESPVDILHTPLERWIAAEDHARAGALANPDNGQRDLEIELLAGQGRRIAVRASIVSASEDFATILFTDLVHLLQSEAQATLEAIRRGEVDALMVDDSGVVLLETALSPYRELVERMRHGVLTISDECRVTYVNARFRSMVGATHAALPGLHVEDLVIETDRRLLAEICASPTNTQVELHLRTGADRAIAVQAAMITHQGQRMFLFTDLTERKRHLASDELTRKFLGLLASEFQDMLSTIDRSAQTLRRLEGLDGEANGALDAIARTTQMMALLADDLRRVNRG
jgi:PAS domain S-box-containing protein